MWHPGSLDKVPQVRRAEHQSGSPHALAHARTHTAAQSPRSSQRNQRYASRTSRRCLHRRTRSWLCMSQASKTNRHLPWTLAASAASRVAQRANHQDSVNRAKRLQNRLIKKESQSKQSTQSKSRKPVEGRPKRTALTRVGVEIYTDDLDFHRFSHLTFERKPTQRRNI